MFTFLIDIFLFCGIPHSEKIETDKGIFRYMNGKFRIRLGAKSSHPKPLMR